MCNPQVLFQEGLEAIPHRGTDKDYCTLLGRGDIVRPLELPDVEEVESDDQLAIEDLERDEDEDIEPHEDEHPFDESMVDALWDELLRLDRVETGVGGSGNGSDGDLEAKPPDLGGDDGKDILESFAAGLKTIGANGLKWGVFTLTCKRSDGGSGYQARCPFHKKNKSSGCKRFFNFPVDLTKEDTIAMIRRMKWWCLIAHDHVRQRTHLLAELEDAEIPGDELLEAMALVDEPVGVLTDIELDALDKPVARGRGRGRAGRSVGRGGRRGGGGRGHASRSGGSGSGGGSSSTSASSSTTTTTSTSDSTSD